MFDEPKKITVCSVTAVCSCYIVLVTITHRLFLISSFTVCFTVIYNDEVLTSTFVFVVTVEEVTISDSNTAFIIVTASL